MAIDPLLERRRIVESPGRHASRDDVAHHRTVVPPDGRLADVVHFEQHALDLDGVDFLAADIDQVASAAQNLHEPAVHRDGITGIVPAV